MHVISLTSADATNYNDHCKIGFKRPWRNILEKRIPVSASSVAIYAEASFSRVNICRGKFQSS